MSMKDQVLYRTFSIYPLGLDSDLDFPLKDFVPLWFEGGLIDPSPQWTNDEPTSCTMEILIEAVLTVWKK